MLRRALLPVLGTSLTLLALGVTAGDNRHRSFRASADLVPTQEVPSVSSVARGRFKATIDRANQTISYELSYEGLEAAPTQAHIHVGQRRVNGGISRVPVRQPADRAAGRVPAAAGLPACPGNNYRRADRREHRRPRTDKASHRRLNGVNEFDELVEMILDGLSYANVHSAKFPAGEVRGQLRTDQRHGKR